MTELSNLLFTMLMLNIEGVRGAKYQPYGDAYETHVKAFPRIYANDGFNISIQCHPFNYCSTENGYRTFGKELKDVEWGYPSEEISTAYNPEDSDNTKDTVGCCDVTLLDQLIKEHGGIDYKTTFAKAYSIYCENINREAKTRHEAKKICLTKVFD